MAFTPEDGTGLPDANSYVALAEADDWLADRGYADWAALATAERQSRLVRATDYLTDMLTFGGERAVDGQGLAWPRLDACDAEGSPIASNVVPSALKRATYLLALNATTALTIERERATLSESVDGVGSRSFAAGNDAPMSMRERFPQVFALVAPLIEGSAESASTGNVRLFRS